MSQWVKKSRQKKINNSRQFNLNFPQHAKYSKLVLTHHITKIYLISRVYFHFELKYKCTGVCIFQGCYFFCVFIEKEVNSSCH